MFLDQTAVVRWLGEHPSTVVWDDINDAYAVHCPDPRTVIHFVDPPAGLRDTA